MEQETKKYKPHFISECNSDCGCREIIEEDLKERPVEFTSPYYDKYQTLKYLTDKGWKRWILKHIFDFDYEYIIKDLKRKEKDRRLASHPSCLNMP